MHRRSFVAAVPALIPALAFAQEASPQAEPLPEALMASLIDALFIDRSISDAAALISPGIETTDAMILSFAKIIDWIDERYGDDPIAITTRMLTSQGNAAVALLDIGDPREVYAFLYIVTDGTGIVGLRHRWGEF